MNRVARASQDAGRPTPAPLHDTGAGALLWNLGTAAVIGLLTGACVAAATGTIEDTILVALARLPGATPALFSLPALLLTWWVAHSVTRTEKPTTSELYVATYHEPGGWVPLRQVPGRLLAAATTVAFGGSQGFESASVLVGASWSRLLARWQRPPLSEDARRSLLAAGASAGIAAVFSSPAMGMIYGMEIPYKRDLDAPRLPGCAIAAVVSYGTRAWLIGPRRLVEQPAPVVFDLTLVLGCLAVALACGLGARLFALAIDGLHVLRRVVPRGARALVGGLMLAALAWAGFALTGRWITFGPGYLAGDWVQEQPQPLWLLGLAFLVRFSGNLVSVFGGGGGGVFTSLACNGLFLGEMVATLIGCTQSRLLGLLGAGCFLASGYRLPLACMLFIAESSGSLTATACGLVVVAIGQVLMGDASVSDAQVERRTTAGTNSGD